MKARQNVSSPFTRAAAAVPAAAGVESAKPATKGADRLLAAHTDCNPLMALAWDAVQRGYLGAIT